jgi:hypothetical protein
LPVRLTQNTGVGEVTAASSEASFSQAPMLTVQHDGGSVRAQLSYAGERFNYLFADTPVFQQALRLAGIEPVV